MYLLQNILIFGHQGATKPIEVLNRDFEALKGPIKLSHRSTKHELGLPDAFKTSLGATVFILEDYEHLPIRRSIEDNLLLLPDVDDENCCQRVCALQLGPFVSFDFEQIESDFLQTKTVKEKQASDCAKL